MAQKNTKQPVWPPNRIEYWLDRRGMKRKQLAEAIGTTEQTIGRLINRERQLTPTWMNKMAPALKVLPTQFLQKDENAVSSARLVGRIGKSEVYYPSASAGPWESYDEIEAPLGLDDADALEVSGDWLKPVYYSGDVLYFRREPRSAPHDFLNRECVVSISETRACLKIVREGSRDGLYNLHSVLGDSVVSPLLNVQVQWCAPVLYANKKGER